jgi:uncharacterized protein (TIGR00369 family)
MSVNRLDSPYASMMGIAEDCDAEGNLVLSMDFGDHVMGRPGYAHGGAIAGLLEAAGFATLSNALSVQDEGTTNPALKPVTVTVTYFRAGLEKTTYAAAKIERMGRRVANVEAIAWQDNREKPIAMAQMNIIIDREG